MLSPYYQDSNVIIYHGNCRDILPELSRCDLVLTDPPYGIDIASRSQVGGSVLANNTQHTVSDWDSQRLDQEIINILLGVGKVKMIFGGNYIADLLPPSACWLTWNKRGDYPSNNFADCEYIWTSLEKPSRIYKYFWQGMLQQDMRNKEIHYHPTQKPVSLMRWCINLIECQTIIDPFMGSGSTLRAAKDLNKKCIGIDIDEKYCEIAATRCSQLSLESVTDIYKKCYICGYPLIGKRKHSNYCSNKCRQAAFRNRLNHASGTQSTENDSQGE